MVVQCKVKRYGQIHNCIDQRSVQIEDLKWPCIELCESTALWLRVQATSPL